MRRFRVDSRIRGYLVLIFVILNVFLPYYYFKLSGRGSDNTKAPKRMHLAGWTSSKEGQADSIPNSHMDTSTSSGLTTVDIFRDKLDQAHPAILEYIRKNHLTPPSTEEYNLNKTISKITYPLNDQLNEKIRKIFKDKKNGIFVECGALDGEMYSHTLFLETQLNWTGVLIEGSKTNIVQLKKKNRKAIVVDACLGSSPEKMEFLIHRGKDVWNQGNGKLMPISNLDVEGHELHILKSIPFDRVKIEYIGVEHWLVPEGKLAIRDLMEKNGYKLIFEIDSDYIFQRSSTFFE